MDHGWEIRSGKKSKWKIIRQIGSGDAGEVFLAENSSSHEIAVLKSAAANVGTAVRQKNLLQREAACLEALADLVINDGHTTTRAVKILDISSERDSEARRFFIVLELAPGIEISQLLGADRQRKVHSEALDHQSLLDVITSAGQIPPLLLLRVLSGCLEYLKKIHHFQFQWFGETKYGLIWNDIKPDHIFFDWQAEQVCLIDWSNCQVLQRDGITEDRRYSRALDFGQYIDEIGKVLQRSDPALLRELRWPSFGSPTRTEEEIRAIAARLKVLLEEEYQKLKVARDEEYDLSKQPKRIARSQTAIHQNWTQLIALGVSPHYDLIEKTSFEEYKSQLDDPDPDNEELVSLAEWAASTSMDSYQRTKWKILAILPKIRGGFKSDRLSTVSNLVLNNQWINAFWEVFSFQAQIKVNTGDEPSSWWAEIKPLLLSQIPELTGRIFTPYEEFDRLYFRLKAVDKRNDLRRIKVMNGQNTAVPLSEALFEAYKNWSDPCAIGGDLLSYPLIDLLQLVPRNDLTTAENLDALLAGLQQPNYLAGSVAAAWQKQDFDTARELLRTWAIWDPERICLKAAADNLSDAEDWYAEVSAELRKDRRNIEPGSPIFQKIQEGRLFEKYFGMAPWLEDVLARLPDEERDRRLAEERDRQEQERRQKELQQAETGRAHLENFIDALKSMNFKTAEAEILSLPRGLQSHCETLLAGFRNITDLGYLHANKTEEEFQPYTTTIRDALKVYRLIINWKASFKKSLVTAAEFFKSVEDNDIREWESLRLIQSWHTDWQREGQPFIELILHKNWDKPVVFAYASLFKPIFERLSNAKTLWLNAKNRGISEIDLKAFLNAVNEADKLYQEFKLEHLTPKSGHSLRGKDRMLISAPDWQQIMEAISGLKTIAQNAVQDRNRFTTEKVKPDKKGFECANRYFGTLDQIERWFYCQPDKQVDDWKKTLTEFERSKSHRTLWKEVAERLNTNHPLYFWLSSVQPAVDPWRIIELSLSATLMVVILLAATFIYKFLPEQVPTPETASSVLGSNRRTSMPPATAFHDDGVNIVTTDTPTPSSTETPTLVPRPEAINSFVMGWITPQDGVNCRDEPNIHSQSYGILPLDAQVKILGVGQDEDWVYISEENQYGVACWIKAEFVNVGEDNLARLPVVPEHSQCARYVLNGDWAGYWDTLKEADSIELSQIAEECGGIYTPEQMVLVAYLRYQQSLWNAGRSINETEAEIRTSLNNRSIMLPDDLAPNHQDYSAYFRWLEGMVAFCSLVGESEVPNLVLTDDNRAVLTSYLDSFFGRYGLDRGEQTFQAICQMKINDFLDKLDSLPITITTQIPAAAIGNWPTSSDDSCVSFSDDRIKISPNHGLFCPILSDITSPTNWSDLTRIAFVMEFTEADTKRNAGMILWQGFLDPVEGVGISTALQITKDKDDQFLRLFQMDNFNHEPEEWSITEFVLPSSSPTEVKVEIFLFQHILIWKINGEIMQQPPYFLAFELMTFPIQFSFKYWAPQQPDYDMFYEDFILEIQ